MIFRSREQNENKKVDVAERRAEGEEKETYLGANSKITQLDLSSCVY